MSDSPEVVVTDAVYVADAAGVDGVLCYSDPLELPETAEGFIDGTDLVVIAGVMRVRFRVPAYLPALGRERDVILITELDDEGSPCAATEVRMKWPG